jgi:Myb-like DNA-binding domain
VGGEVFSKFLMKSFFLIFKNDSDWSFLSEMIPNTTCTRLKMKWVSLQNSKNQKEPWSVEDLCLLSEIVLKNKGNKWTKIAEEFNSKSKSKIVRLGKHCREKWNNHLNPDLKKFI